MRRRGALALLFASVVAACGGGGVEASPDAAPDAVALDAAPTPVDVLWIGAHPDDESFLAPLLGQECVDRGRRCGFVVATRGERGSCKRPSLCANDLAGVRDREMAASAARYGATLEHWDLGDSPAGTPTGVAAAWSGRVGSDRALIDRVKQAIVLRAPTEVYTFDPRHGSTCHADHRAIAAVVAIAIAELGAAAPTLRFLQSQAELPAPGQVTGMRAWVPADAAVVHLDADVARAGGGTLWDYLVETLALHASQFTDGEVAAFAAVAAAGRAVYWSPAPALGTDDPRYANLCP